jgi:small neutral amino acid transporter SnatA (MarC family)
MIKKPPVTTDNIGTYLSKDPNTRPPVWRTRERVCFATLLFCATCIMYILIAGKEVAVYETIAMGCFGLAGSTLGFLIGAQTWHNINGDKLDAVERVRNSEIGSHHRTQEVAPIPAPVPVTDGDEK